MSINFQLLSFEFLNEKHPNFFQEIILRKYFMERTTIGTVYKHLFFAFLSPGSYSTIGSCASVRSSRYEAGGKFGEHERCVRVARGVADSNSSFLSALQTS